ncbi:MAG: DUF2149 domain-containing protein [Kangiellaceae bacterium]|nr:DUF2149 domain-containing protein [Kangiellaceae bacterium]MCW9000469.1 DUF2149 domain-containing protein [Kangiellaceae bacterium]MCW9016233.1 DUF2149 domain-containing protein [Kangiellaceae bacterium]
MQSKIPWQSNTFVEQDTDPLTGFANIMDVMLVFSLGIMLALVAQSKELRTHLAINNSEESARKITVQTGDELLETPESLEQVLQGQASGYESLGRVYKDPKTGKLILISSD